MQKIMSLKYEPSSEPLHISVKLLVAGPANRKMASGPGGRGRVGITEILPFSLGI